MRAPGSEEGNWTWRCDPELLTAEHAVRLRELTLRTRRV